MKKEWKILLYKSPQGEAPVNSFILSLEPKGQLKVRNSLNLLKNFGLRIGVSHVKKLIGTELWELRILGSDSTRILYVTISGQNFLLLHGFKKKTNKTPSKEIKIAEKRLAEFKSRPE